MSKYETAKQRLADLTEAATTGDWGWFDRIVVKGKRQPTVELTEQDTLGVGAPASPAQGHIRSAATLEQAWLAVKKAKESLEGVSQTLADEATECMGHIEKLLARVQGDARGLLAESVGDAYTSGNLVKDLQRRVSGNAIVCRSNLSAHCYNTQTIRDDAKPRESGSDEGNLIEVLTGRKGGAA